MFAVNDDVLVITLSLPKSGALKCALISLGILFFLTAMGILGQSIEQSGKVLPTYILVAICLSGLFLFDDDWKAELAKCDRSSYFSIANFGLSILVQSLLGGFLIAFAFGLVAIGLAKFYLPYWLYITPTVWLVVQATYLAVARMMVSVKPTSD